MESATGGHDHQHGLSVVIPCYNSQANLERLVAQLGDVLPRCRESYELILVNDGSRDKTWELIGALAARHAWVRGLNLMRNYGQHNATLCGIRAARFDVIVTLDDDLQHPPAEIPHLLAKLQQGFDVVYGTPKHTSQSFYRKVASWLIRRALVLGSGQSTARDVSGFRAFRATLMRSFADYRSPQVLVDALFTWGTTSVTSVAVTHDPRPSGESNYGFFDLLGTVALLWTGFTTAPLRLASWLGFFFVLVGGGILAYVLGVYFLAGSIPGFPFLASTIALFGGVQLFALGIIGEYLARLFSRSLDRPTYVVRECAPPCVASPPQDVLSTEQN